MKKTPPKPKKKPMTPKEEKEIQKALDNVAQMQKFDAEEAKYFQKQRKFEGIGKKGTQKKPQALKCGGKVKGAAKKKKK